RLGEKSRSLPKNLIRSPELTILTLEHLDPLELRRPRALPLAIIPLRLPHPAPQRVTRATDLLRSQLDRRPLRRVFPLGVQHQPNRPLPDLSGVPLRLVHDPNPSKIAASGKPRAVQGYLSGSSTSTSTSTSTGAARILRLRAEAVGRSARERGRPRECDGNVYGVRCGRACLGARCRGAGPSIDRGSGQ